MTVAFQAGETRGLFRRSSTAGRSGRRWSGWHLPPGWPLSWLLIGYPIWWVLGVTEPASLVAAGIMAVELVQRRQIRVPKAFGVWLLFLVWVVAGALVVQVDPQGAVAGDSPTRYLTGGFRLTWYLRATIVLLYVINMRAELTTRWVARTFSWMFVTITAGGLLGTLVPTFTFPSLLELALPPGVRSIPFVRSMIHPVASELQNNLGDGSLRPSAPFTYANEWGFNFACFLPFFLLAWCGEGAGWRKLAAPVVLALAVVPVVFSLNRGLWLALLAAGAFALVRSVLAGRIRVIVLSVAGIALAATLVVGLGLGAVVQTRLQNGNSDEGRTTLAVLGLTTMARTSPVVGLGTTRQVQGGFESIAQGSTPNCPRCSPPSMGTQGQLSLVAFCQGIGGFLLYFGFLGFQFLRHLRLRSPTATLGLSVIVVHLVTSPIYGADNLGLLAVLAGIGLLCREAGPSATPATLAAYAYVVRRHVILLAYCACLGADIGIAMQYQQGTLAIAKVSILVPEEPSYLGDASAARTLDTEAQLASDAASRTAVDKVAGDPSAAGRLDITAVPNSRILNLTYSTTAGMDNARSGVSAAARAALRARQTALQERQSETLRSLTSRSIALSSAVADLDRVIARQRAQVPPGERFQELTTVADTRYRLLSEAGNLNSQISRATSLPLELGQTLGPPEVRETLDGMFVAVAGGLMLGLVAGLLLAMGREAVARVPFPRRRSRRDGIDPEVPRTPQRRVAYISVDGDPTAVAAAGRLDRATRAGSSPEAALAPLGELRASADDRRVVLVASRKTRARTMRDVAAGLERTGAVVVGVIHARR